MGVMYANTKPLQSAIYANTRPQESAKPLQVKPQTGRERANVVSEKKQR